jgi:hypothetical protein
MFTKILSILTEDEKKVYGSKDNAMFHVNFAMKDWLRTHLNFFKVEVNEKYVKMKNKRVYEIDGKPAWDIAPEKYPSDFYEVKKVDLKNHMWGMTYNIDSHSKITKVNKYTQFPISDIKIYNKIASQIDILQVPIDEM